MGGATWVRAEQQIFLRLLGIFAFPVILRGANISPVQKLEGIFCLPIFVNFCVNAFWLILKADFEASACSSRG